MEKQVDSISGLYYRYKRASDEAILKLLAKCPIVILTNKGVGTIQGYYPLNEASMEKIRSGPRKTSLTFDAVETSDTPIEGLTEYRKITYLVKSSSRFFLKPDIGEIIDQINPHDLWGDHVHAICFESGYEELPDTDREHFLMKALLLKKK